MGGGRSAGTGLTGVGDLALFGVLVPPFCTGLPAIPYTQSGEQTKQNNKQAK